MTESSRGAGVEVENGKKKERNRFPYAHNISYYCAINHGNEDM
jgi:hypothetical protein